MFFVDKTYRWFRKVTYTHVQYTDFYVVKRFLREETAIMPCCVAYGCANDMHDAHCEVSFHRLLLKKPALLKQMIIIRSIMECEINTMLNGGWLSLIWRTLHLMIRMFTSVPNIFFQRILLVVWWKGSDLWRRCWSPMQYLQFSTMCCHQSERKLVRLKLLWLHTRIWSMNCWVLVWVISRINSNLILVRRHTVW